MAGAEIIASGIGILCLIIFGYVLVGGILSVGENAASAQNDYILMKESQRETAIEIPHSSPIPQFSCGDDSWVVWTWKNCTLTFNITNTGTEMLGDFNQMDVSVKTSEDIIEGNFPFNVIHPANTVIQYTFDQSQIVIGGNEPSGTWAYTQISPDIIHPNRLDPGEKMQIKINNFYYFIRFLWNPPPALPYPAQYTIEVVTPNGITDTYTKI